MLRKMTKEKRYIIVLILAALLSVLVLTRVFSSPKLYSGVLVKLDEKKTTVMELTAAAAATSTAITMMPDDIATPIAEKIADTSSYFLIVLCVLLLEKYLLTLSGYVTFGALIPLACILFILYIKTKKNALKEFGKKLVIIGAAFVTIIPVSVLVSGAVETTYQASIEATLAAAENSTSEIEETLEESGEEKGLLEGVWSKISGGVKGFTDRVENLLGRFVEAVAVLVVVNCLIPILAAAVFVWIVKGLLR